MSFETDSANYEVLVDATSIIGDVPGFSCEIGVRKGGGTYFIILGLEKHNDKRHHIGIDPYGCIPIPETFPNHEEANIAKRTFLKDIYDLCLVTNRDYTLYNLEDSEFFRIFKDGIITYTDEKRLINEYALVHFDGPHTIEKVREEYQFFIDKTPVGGVWIFDDVGMYDHDTIDREVKDLGFEVRMKTDRKISYVYRGNGFEDKSSEVLI